MDDETHRDDLIVQYFDLGLSITDIPFILFHEHGCTLSIRQVKRIVKRKQRSRRCYSNPFDIAQFIHMEMTRSGVLHGYRIMYTKCIQSGLRVRMEDVRHVLNVLDEDGVQLRRTRRLRRRDYYAKGPNYIWHVDGFDKLKPYGLCIHGSICGFSRKIIWMNVHHTNNNPRVIGGYFIEAVRMCGGCPRLVRGDFGTENVRIRDFQQFLRRRGTDDQSQRSYLDGPSTANQRIECWWGFLKKECAQFWIDHFKQLVNDGEFDGSFLHKSLVHFCYMALIQDELDRISLTWNNHTIRPSRNLLVPSGRPFQMYTIPEMWGAEDEVYTVNQDDVDICSAECSFRSHVPCDQDVFQLCTEIMSRENLEPATDLPEAMQLYSILKNEIESVL